MRTLLLYLLLAVSTTSFAQERKTYRVNPGQRVSEALLLNNGLYQYPKFTMATVKYKNGNEGGGLLNYNRLTGEMQFIDPKEDTLSLDKEEEIASIAIGKDTFYFSQGFLQVVDQFSVTIAKKTLLEVANRQKLGGFGEVNQSANESHTFVYSNQGVKDIVPREILTLEEKSIYYIGNRFGHFKPLNKKTLLNHFSKQEKAVSQYLQDNPVNFIQEEDVKRLIAYLKTL